MIRENLSNFFNQWQLDKDNATEILGENRKYNADLSTISWTTMIGASSGHVEISPTAFLISNCCALSPKASKSKASVPVINI